jgi:hypothetical protein
MVSNFNRDDAFTMNLGGDSQNPIQQILITLDHSLYIFTAKKIYRILTADDIDPTRTNKETRHSYQEIYPIGCNNSFIARSIIQAKQIFEGIILKPRLVKDVLLSQIWEATKYLLLCENAHYRIYNNVMTLLADVDGIIEKSKSMHTIPSLPQVDDLEERVTTFLGGAKRFLEQTHKLLCMFYDAPDLGANFKGYYEWMTVNAPTADKITSLLIQDQEWISLLSTSRNALPVNHSKDNYLIEIRNFTLEPGNKFSAPSWRHDLSDRGGPVQTLWSDIVTDMNTHLQNMLTFLEEIYILCVLDNQNKLLPFTSEVYRLPNDRINPECPMLYIVQTTKLDT